MAAPLNTVYPVVSDHFSRTGSNQIADLVVRHRTEISALGCYDSLVAFPTFRRALFGGDGSLRKLTYLSLGAGTATYLYPA
jgi:hypothetical protein